MQLQDLAGLGLIILSYPPSTSARFFCLFSGRLSEELLRISSLRWAICRYGGWKDCGWRDVSTVGQFEASEFDIPQFFNLFKQANFLDIFAFIAWCSIARCLQNLCILILTFPTLTYGL